MNVFSGEVTLSITKFLKALKDMEAATQSTVTSVSGFLDTLDTNVKASMANISSYAQNVSTQATSAAQALTTGLNAQVTAQKTASSSLTQAQTDQHKADLALLEGKLTNELALIDTNNTTIENDLKTSLQTRSNDYKNYNSQVLADTIEANNSEISSLNTKITAEKAALADLVTAVAQAKASMILTSDKTAFNELETEWKTLQGSVKTATENIGSYEKQLATVTQDNAKLITASVRAQNEESAPHLSAFSTAMQNLSTKVSDAEAKWRPLIQMGGQIQQFGSTLSGFAREVKTLDTNLVTSAQDSDFWVRNLKSVTDQAGTSSLSLHDLSMAAMGVAEQLGTFDAAQTAQGWYYYSSALGETLNNTEDLKRSQEGFTTVMQAATVSQTDLKTATRGTTEVLSAYGAASDQASHFAEVMLNVSSLSNAEFSDMTTAFKYVGDGAASMGVNFNDTAAILAKLSDAGIKGSAAGRGLAEVFKNLANPSAKANDALQQLLVTNQGLTGSWKDIVFEGGNFIGMTDTINNGIVTHEGFLHKLSDSLKDATGSQKEQALGQIFAMNSMREMIPLVNQYVDQMNSSGTANNGVKTTLDGLAVSFNDNAKQTELFKNRWEEVSGSLKVQMGDAKNTISDSFQRIGLIIGEAILPMVQKIAGLTKTVADWAEAHPQVATAIGLVVTALGILAGILGPILIAVGGAIGLVGTLSVAFASVGGIVGVASAAISAIGVALLYVIPTIAIVAALAFGLYEAWQHNWLDIHKLFDDSIEWLKGWGESFKDMFGGIFDIIVGLITGDNDKVKAGIDQFGIACVEAFSVIPGKIFMALGSR